MSVSAIAQVSIDALDAAYTLRNISTATAFAVQAPARRQVEKDVRSEDDAIQAELREAERVSATAAALTFRRKNDRQDGEHKKRNSTFATFEDILEEEASTFDSYA